MRPTHSHLMDWHILREATHTSHAPNQRTTMPLHPSHAHTCTETSHPGTSITTTNADCTPSAPHAPRSTANCADTLPYAPAMAYTHAICLRLPRGVHL